MYRVWFALLGRLSGGSEHWIVCGKEIYQNLRADVQIGAVSGNMVLQTPFDLYGAITDGEEHTLTTRVDLQGRYSLFLDGVFIARSSQLQFYFDSDQLLVGDVINSGIEQSFNGIYYKVQLWNVALSDYQIDLGEFTYRVPFFVCLNSSISLV
jgi:hypothetical protein